MSNTLLKNALSVPTRSASVIKQLDYPAVFTVTGITDNAGNNIDFSAGTVTVSGELSSGQLLSGTAITAVLAAIGSWTPAGLNAGQMYVDNTVPGSISVGLGRTFENNMALPTAPTTLQLGIAANDSAGGNSQLLVNAVISLQANNGQISA